MYIRTDDDGNVLEVISVGAKPEHNGYEVETIDRDILNDIFSYKYINGNFVKSETFKDIRQEKIDAIKDIKISNMSAICYSLIINGIDYQNSHYSLSEHDQLNLMRHSFSAMINPSGTFLYHADGESCREYSATDITNISTLAEKWKTYHLTYFNALKQYIQNIADVDEVINVKYGIKLSDEVESLLSEILQTDGTLTVDFPRDIVSDGFNYDGLFPKVDVDELYNAYEIASDKEKVEEEGQYVEPSVDEILVNGDDTSETDQ